MDSADQDNARHDSADDNAYSLQRGGILTMQC